MRQVLESLHGSQSFVSAICLAISLRSWSVLSFAILLLWFLSPLGGQSSLCLLHEANSTVVTSRPVYYPDPGAYSSLASLGFAHYLNQMRAIISTSISTTDTLQNSPVDIWNHPEIPRLRQLEQADLSHDSQDQWIDVNEDTTAYTSLTGLSVLGLHANSIVIFSVIHECR